MKNVNNTVRSRQHTSNTSSFTATVAICMKKRTFAKILKEFSFLTQIFSCLLLGNIVFHANAPIDPGSDGTYVLDHISYFLNLDNDRHVDVDVKIKNSSRTFSLHPQHSQLLNMSITRNRLNSKMHFPINASIFKLQTRQS